MVAMIEWQRLISLIEFAQQSAALKGSPVSDVANHRTFSEYEHSLQGLPGLHFNDGADDDEVWLRVDRLHEIPAPLPKNDLLKVWIDVSNTPAKEPTLKSATELNKLIEIAVYKDKEADSKALVFLSDFEEKPEVEGLLKAYIEIYWAPWAKEEKQRRHIIKLYENLFRLKQMLEGSLIDSAIEVVWGIGIGISKVGEAKICYPLITQLLDININETTMAAELRPRDTEPRLEMDIYTATANPGCAELEKAWKDFNNKQTQAFSPFDRMSYDTILRHAATCLDSKGVYWPSQTLAEDRTIPAATEELKITDTWVIFARPRSKNLFIQDLDRFKKEIENKDNSTSIPEAVMALVSDPSTEHTSDILSSYRGMSMVYGNEGSEKPKELYFPLAFNDDQVRIVQLLDKHDGVVVQGPPGTGKTHTIANIICHYFALGKRVLVTSMKEPALAVLRDKLPEEVRPLAISLLASEQDGMKQFEHAISKISSEVQIIDKQAYKREITDLEENRINAFHAQLALIDKNIESWAKKSLKPILIDGGEIGPVDAAKEVLTGLGIYEWLTDELNVSETHIPQFEDTDIAILRTARKTTASDISYLNDKLPEIENLLDSKEILRLHQDLSRHSELTRAIDTGNLIPLLNYQAGSIEKALILAENIRLILSHRRQIQEYQYGWSSAAYDLCRQNNSALPELLVIFDKLAEDMSKALAERKKFVERPVSIPDQLEMNEDIFRAVHNKIEDKLPFGITGIVGKSQLKLQMQDIKVLSKAPETVEDWKHVREYMHLMRTFRELITRWNSVAPELKIDAFDSNDPRHSMTAERKIQLFSLIRKRVSIEEKSLTQAAYLLPTWEHKDYFINGEALLQEVQKALESHVLRHKLSSSWADKEKLQGLLSKYSGDITDKLKSFINIDLGNPSISDVALQGHWSSLMERLRYLHSLRSAFADIRDICSRIEKSGASNWANKLRLEAANDTVDTHLPTNWRQAWRLRQLANYLEASDGRMHLKALFRQRYDLEKDLAKVYRQVVVKRTWLKLAENATPSVRSALEAFRSSIAKIGKGTGKRAVRHRQDARNAASAANHAIPCWIMPHLRVSESLPADLGCFDLVIIDEASQSDLTALPALLRAKKVLIVGDDKQVSPEGVGLEEEKIRGLMSQYLATQVDIYRAQMTPERSIYDLLKVVFASSSTMLKEHFRCVGPIIEYSKREFYNHELKPVRLAKSSERLDPPLVDIFIQDGVRDKDVNRAEARFIVDEIKRICGDPLMSQRTIGVVSLLGDKQALLVWDMLEKELGPEEIKKHQIACGDARTFQGKERSIMFLSMVSSPKNVHAQTRDTYEQRFNVAASRAQDRMYLVRSLGIDDLSSKDVLRRNLISHFSTPFAQDETCIENLRSFCESDFEREVYDLLTERGYKVIPQVKVGGYRIDMVVEGNNDTRLAIECDGDQYHGADKWDDDMRRQRTLERVGWRFWRCFASIFVKNRKDVVEDLISTLTERGIEPIGSDTAPRSIHTELRNVIVFPNIHTSSDDSKDLFENEDIAL